MADKELISVELVDGSTIKGEDVEFEVIKEGWNIYKLADGTTVKCRLVATSMVRAVDENGEYETNADGTPYVVARSNILVISKA